MIYIYVEQIKQFKTLTNETLNVMRKARKTMSQALAELSSMSYLRQRDGRISNY